MTKRMKILILLVVIFSYANHCFGQAIEDTINKSALTAQNVADNSIQNNQVSPAKTYQSVVTKLLQNNSLLHISNNSILLLHSQKNATGKEFLFYFLSIIILLLGIFKSFYSGYFNNIFRVFFNTSLRQNQLTDILLQARLPSLLFNIFFVIISGFYLWLVLVHYHLLNFDDKILIPVSIILVGLIYFGKFLVLKFIGWISGMKEITDTYIFITFLINKIAGVILIPFIILIAFSQNSWANTIILLSFLIMVVFFLLRFFRSYGLVENKISISYLHFVIYIIAIEILPIFLIYKLVINTLV